MSIESFWVKIKGFTESIRRSLFWQDALTTLVVALTAFGSFGLGKLSVANTQKFPITLEGQDQSHLPHDTLTSEIAQEPVNNSSDPLQQGGEVVASKSGTKYHYPWCPGAKQISEKNMITFSTAEEAVKAGYSPASNCKGLAK